MAIGEGNTLNNIMFARGVQTSSLIKTNLLPLSGFTSTGILGIFSLLNPEAEILTLIWPLNLSRN